MNRSSLFVLVVLACPFFSSAACAVDGKWTPEQILQHDPQWLRQLGLEIPPQRLWSKDGAGLLEAAVKIDGCSAGFVSAAGLVITNHHCAFGIIQLHSTPERDLIAEGYLAKSRAEELQGTGTRATLPHRMLDVTSEVLAAVPKGADDLARFRAIERKGKELVAECEKRPYRRCQAEAFDGGVRYLLIESIEFPDVRLVYAPPRAVGEYGGEIDNWSWPRHSGDFALLRVYAGADGNPAPRSPENVAYQPRHFFPLAEQGVAPGDFVMLAGYPAVTVRSFTAAEMRERAERYHPERAALYARWIAIMDAASAKDDAARIALADRAKSLANREKSSRGQVAGIRRGRILEKKESSEREILGWAAGKPHLAQAVGAHAEIARRVAEADRTWSRDFLLEQAKNGPKPLELALTLARWSREKVKPDLDRESDYMERNRERLKERLERDQKRMHPPTEAVLLADVLTRFAALPEGARVPAVEALLAPGSAGSSARTPEAVSAKAAEILAETKVTDLEARNAMFEESEAQLAARHDPLLDLALALDRELAAWKEREDRAEGAVSRLRPQWLAAVYEHTGRPVAPDANGTLRVSLAHVAGYAPRDAVTYTPQTTVAGLAEKHTGEEPFNAPAALLAAAGQAPASRWADPRLGDVPVCFLADADTSGGNSGSPVVNGRGELVGVNFDRVWENVANDFGYNPQVARNVSVDIRYLLWVLETTHGGAASALLTELGVN